MFNLSQVRFWTTIRNPMKIIFQVIIPPIFAIVGLVLMRQSASAADANVVKNLELSPSLYLAQNASVSSKLTEILFQNKTSIADILSATDASRLKYSIVQDIGKMKSLHDLGYEVTAVSSVSGKVGCSSMTLNKPQYLDVTIEQPWPSGNALDSDQRGPGFVAHR